MLKILKSGCLIVIVSLVACNTINKHRVVANNTSGNINNASLLTDSSLVKKNIDNLIKADAEAVYDFCEHTINNDDDRITKPYSCSIVPFIGYKFNWNGFLQNNSVHDYRSYLVPDSTSIFFSTNIGDSILGFSSAYYRKNKWKVSFFDKNDGDENKVGTFLNKVLNICKSYTKDVMTIRYYDIIFGYAFYVNNELNIVTFRQGKIVHHKNFNEWAATLAKVPYD
jgi:hypothetical protein